MNSITNYGNGCPKHGDVVAPLNYPLSSSFGVPITFPNFRSTYNTKLPLDSRQLATCFYNITLTLPKGYQFTFNSLGYRAHGAWDFGSTGSVGSIMTFEGHAPSGLGSKNSVWAYQQTLLPYPDNNDGNFDIKTSMHDVTGHILSGKKSGAKLITSCDKQGQMFIMARTDIFVNINPATQGPVFGPIQRFVQLDGILIKDIVPVEACP